ncbi:unnamed protein product [Pleuronectes platessa]|uniref:Secreted protein n=1 Tax=Pleuronectes platessa TaxID=8262 RepID=A0A9N7Z5R0_PLEPL|nr:unnamed protein product [Pleuronectes platessa]
MLTSYSLFVSLCCVVLAFHGAPTNWGFIKLQTGVSHSSTADLSRRIVRLRCPTVMRVLFIPSVLHTSQFMVVYPHMDRYQLRLTTAPWSLTPHPVHTAWWFRVRPQSQRPRPAAPDLISTSLHTGGPGQPLPAP